MAIWPFIIKRAKANPSGFALTLLIPPFGFLWLVPGSEELPAQHSPRYPVPHVMDISRADIGN